MQILKKLLTALRGGATEAGEAIVESQALRILDQELRDATAAQDKAKVELANIMAKEKKASGRLDSLNAEIEGLTSKAKKALDADKNALAREIADEISKLKRALKDEERVCAEFTAFVAKQRKIVVETDRRITAAKQQADTVKARAAIQAAQRSVSSTNLSGSSKLGDAVDSLRLMRERQDNEAAQFEAMESLNDDLSGKSLDDKIKQAGLDDDEFSADNILAGLKAKAE